MADHGRPHDVIVAARSHGLTLNLKAPGRLLEDPAARICYPLGGLFCFALGVSNGHDGNLTGVVK
jgi:hypothetical protein